MQSLSQRASFYGYTPDGSSESRQLGWVTLRTRYLDDALAKIFAQFQGQPLQAVLLGAGMDARPWRLRNIKEVKYDLLAMGQSQLQLLTAKNLHANLHACLHTKQAVFNILWQNLQLGTLGAQSLEQAKVCPALHRLCHVQLV